MSHRFEFRDPGMYERYKQEMLNSGGTLTYACGDPFYVFTAILPPTLPISIAQLVQISNVPGSSVTRYGPDITLTNDGGITFYNLGRLGDI